MSKRAIGHIMRPCRTIFPSVLDEVVGQSEPFSSGEYFHQVTLDTLGPIFVGEPEKSRKAPDMCVDRDPLDYAMRVPQDDIRGLSRDTRNFKYLTHRLRDFPIVIRGKILGSRENVLCLRAIETCRMNESLELGWFCKEIIFEVRVASEKFRCHLVNFFIGTLSGELDSNQ